VAEKVGHTLPTGLKGVMLADGKAALKVPSHIPISTTIVGAPIDDIAYVIGDLAEELIVGVRVMKFYGMLNPLTNTISVGKNYTSFELYSHH
jgi:hypothetical protein